jgi:hypothetical protein
METNTLDHIPFKPKFEDTSKVLRLRSDSQKAELQLLLDQAVNIAKPKALYKLVMIEAKDDHGVTLEGEYIKSRVLRVNLEKAQRAFLYLATCGKELYDWKMALDDPLLQYYADTINYLALLSARETLLSYLKERYQVENSATMNPGSLDNWPLQGQIPLFKLLGDTQAKVGVELTESLLMIPNQSVSGILFETETHFASCQLCPMSNCPNRRAPYDETLYEHKYALSED